MYDQIYRYCFFKLRNLNIAEDVTQQTFLKFYESTTYKDSDKQINYLYTIARNLCIDVYRKQENILQEEFIEGMAAELEWEHTMDTSIALQIGIDGLPEDEREILFLRYTEDLSVTTIAELQGISRYAVYRKLDKAIQHLKNELGVDNIW